MLKITGSLNKTTSSRNNSNKSESSKNNDNRPASKRNDSNCEDDGFGIDKSGIKYAKKSGKLF